MKAVASLAKRFLLAAPTAVLLLSFTIFGQTPPARPNGKPAKALNLLVLGDSVSWGQGLKDEHKAWYLVKSWLQQNSGREVRERIEAHSGALIGSPAAARNDPAFPLDGELSRAVPTVNNQIDDALKAYADPAQVDLVLVDGCINDLDSRRLLNAANTPDGIRELARAKCGAPVEALLTRITTAFPSAHVIVTGYYPIISENTANDLFMRALAKRFYVPDAGAPGMKDKILRARLIAISREWYETSNQMLTAATHKVDSQLTAKGSRQRVLFANVGFRPEHSFAAEQSRLWGFDASLLRKLLVVMTLGRVTLKANDERRNQRSALCEDLFKRGPEQTPDQKQAREDRLTRCRLAAVGHPNRKGAAMYADAIGTQLKLIIAETGWLKDQPALGSPANPFQ